MADYGFESNDDYDYQLKCLKNNTFKGIKTINVEGHKGRRKTAFASALGQALAYPHQLYYDFTQKNGLEGKVILPPSEDEHGMSEAPVSDFNHIMSESCAFSEGEQTILILDQLQVADFKDHIRIYQFIKNGEWQYGNNTLQASHHNLLLLLISEESLYHSLQKCSFRIWINAVSSADKNYSPADFDLNDDILPVMTTLADVFNHLELAPTRSEYKNILQDTQYHIHTKQQLIHSLYGWMEGVDRALIYSREMQPLLSQVINSIHKYHGIDEVTIAK